MKLAILALFAAIKIMELISVREGTTELKTNDSFTAQELVFMDALLKKVEGKTKKQQNPHAKNNLGWASWMIARLGDGMDILKAKARQGPLLWAGDLKDFMKCLMVGIYTEIATG